MKCLLITLRDNPMMPAKDLRPLLKEFLPRYQQCNSKIIDNFRQKVLRYWLSKERDSEVPDLTMDEAEQLASKTTIAADDVLDLDDKVTLINLGEMFRKAMQESSDTWETIRYLDVIQKGLPGFVYSIKKDDAII